MRKQEKEKEEKEERKETAKRVSVKKITAEQPFYFLEVVSFL